ncbi:MAG: hypothetical protein IJN78_06790 [Clostridia bacterium]|nr:hypothetical protein [Clostridia bacterium]
MKKGFALILSLIIIIVSCINVSAQSTASHNLLGLDTYSNANSRYTHITAVSATIGEKSLGFVICNSSYICILDNYTFTLTCTLQRTDGSTGWQDYKTHTETFTDVGTNIIEKTWYAPAGYTYRTYTTVVVKNSRTGKVVETATADSPFIYR